MAERSAEEEVRAFCQEYMRREQIGQIEYARRLGVAQGTVSSFCGAPQRRLTALLARAVAAHHPELRTIIQAWVNERIFGSPTGAPESPACEQGSAA